MLAIFKKLLKALAVPELGGAGCSSCTNAAHPQSKSELISTGRVSERARVHAVSYYQHQFASGLVPRGIHVSILHKEPECNILLDLGSLVWFQHIIKSAT